MTKTGDRLRLSGDADVLKSKQSFNCGNFFFLLLPSALCPLPSLNLDHQKLPRTLIWFQNRLVCGLKRLCLQFATPSRFEATFVQSGNTFSGSILDDNYLGEAQVNGEVIGRTISFTKRYLVTSPVPVRYTGMVSENEDYIQGEWNIDLQYFGLWSARRSGENLIVDLQTRLEQQTSLTMT